MKKKFLFLILPLFFICSIAFGACGDSGTPADDSSYLIDAFGYEAIHQETIYLKNITYNNSFYKAEISGTICVPKTQYEQTYIIESQPVTFTQVYGHIWETNVAITNLTDPIKIYASRAGKSYTGESKTIECGERVVDAYEMHQYTHIKYIFWGEINYLKYE